MTDYFRLSCELVGWLTIAKSQALEIVYHAHGAAVEGVVGEGESVSWRGARTKGEVRECGITKKMFLHSDLLKLCLKKKHNIPEFFPDTTMFYDLKLALWGNRVKNRELLTNQIIIYRSLTYVEPLKNILEYFWMNSQF